MAITPHFFNKRDPEPMPVRASVPATALPVAPPLSVTLPPASSQVASALPAAHAGSSVTTAQTQPPPAGESAAAKNGGSKLTVGPNIKLKGVEITDCDTLFVEGTVEATMDSRLMQIAPQGAFKGSAEIDIAEIHGQFSGDLTVRDKLTIYATGQVTGKVRYGKLVIEEGGQLSGDIQFGASVSFGKTATANPPGALLAA